MFSKKQEEMLQMLKELGFEQFKTRQAHDGKACYYEFLNKKRPNAEIIVSTTFTENLIEVVDIECSDAMGYTMDWFRNIFYFVNDFSYELEELDIPWLRKEIEAFCYNIWNH